MAAYSKVTLAGFKSKLDSNGYGSITAARRAIGRTMNWSEEDKVKANKLADKHFGAEPAKSLAKTKAPKAPKASAAPAGAKKAPKKAAKAAAAPKAAPAKNTAVTTKAKTAAPRKRAKKVSPEIVVEARMKTLDFTIGSIRQLLTCMQQAKALGDEVDVVCGAQRAQDALVQTVDEVMVLTSKLPPTEEDQEKVDLLLKAANAAKGNNGSSIAVTLPTHSLPSA